MTFTVYLGIGSNLGDRLGYLQYGVDHIGEVAKVSSVYETEPVDVDDEQPLYLNAVLCLETHREARELLNDALRVEADAHRIRTGRRAARTLDIDLLLYDDLQFDEPGLQVPHPRLWHRRFVIEPLRELAPQLVSEKRVDDAYGDVVRTELVLTRCE